MIKEDAKIIDLVNNGTMHKSLEYVTGVTSNCYLLYQKRGWIGEFIRVRIGRIGDGVNPNYTLEYVSDRFEPSKSFNEGQFDKQGSPQQFSGQTHKYKAFGMDAKHWSTATQTLAELEDLKKRLQVGRLPSR